MEGTPYPGGPRVLIEIVVMAVAEALRIQASFQPLRPLNPIFPRSLAADPCSRLQPKGSASGLHSSVYVGPARAAGKASRTPRGACRAPRRAAAPQAFDKEGPGAKAFDPMGMKSDKTMLNEVKNGRLAMIAFLGFTSQAAVRGMGPIESLQAHIADPGHGAAAVPRQFHFASPAVTPAGLVNLAGLLDPAASTLPPPRASFPARLSLHQHRPGARGSAPSGSAPSCSASLQPPAGPQILALPSRYLPRAAMRAPSPAAMPVLRVRQAAASPPPCANARGSETRAHSQPPPLADGCVGVLRVPQ